MGRYTEDDSKKSQEDPRDEFGVKILNTFYDMDSGMMFGLVDAPDRNAVEKHHYKFKILENHFITMLTSVVQSFCAQKLSNNSTFNKDKICAQIFLNTKQR